MLYLFFFGNLIELMSKLHDVIFSNCSSLCIVLMDKIRIVSLLFPDDFTPEFREAYRLAGERIFAAMGALGEAYTLLRDLP